MCFYLLGTVVLHQRGIKTLSVTSVDLRSLKRVNIVKSCGGRQNFV